MFDRFLTITKYENDKSYLRINVIRSPAFGVERNSLIPENTHSPLSATSAIFAIQCVTVTLIFVRVPIKLFFMIPYSSVLLFKYLLLNWLPFFGLYRGSYKLEVPKKGVFKIDINVSTCIAYAYCFLNYHRFHPLNSPSMTNVQKRKKMILLLTPFS